MNFLSIYLSAVGIDLVKFLLESGKLSILVQFCNTVYTLNIRNELLWSINQYKYIDLCGLLIDLMFLLK